MDALCERHFSRSDIMEDFSPLVLSTGVYIEKRVRKRLKGAIPCLFPDENPDPQGPGDETRAISGRTDEIR